MSLRVASTIWMGERRGQDVMQQVRLTPGPGERLVDGQRRWSPRQVERRVPERIHCGCTLGLSEREPRITRV